MVNPNIIHSFDNTSTPKKTFPVSFIAVIIIVALVGLAGGYLFSSMQKNSGSSASAGKPAPAKTAGISDDKTFPDKAEGILKEGGIDGEGNFHLQRPGGTSQNVYLTSTTVDLSQYIGRKVRVKGQTFSGEKAGWLMDVGLVEVLQ